MKCKVAKTAGFCGGVKKAFLMVQENFKTKVAQGRVLIFGSLVHNENVMKMITAMGIEKIDSLEDIRRGDTVIITAHGVGKYVFDEIKSRKAVFFDATCPKVLMVQNCAKEYYEKGFEVIIFGDREHKEIRGINGWCENKASVVGNFKEIKTLIKVLVTREIKKPILLISQTTQSIKKFELAKKLFETASKELGGEIVIVDTICRATLVRQKEALELAKTMEAIVVIGGRGSSNTKQLWKIAKAENINTLWIEDPSELNEKEKQVIFQNIKSVGVISGASTSPSDIAIVRRMIENWG